MFIPGPEELCRTEVFEYALGLTRSDFTLPSFQRHKLLHTIKLFEAGLLEKVENAITEQCVHVPMYLYCSSGIVNTHVHAFSIVHCSCKFMQWEGLLVHV